jgi:hypothetical protein
LNLNLPLLMNNRAGVLTGILEWWKKEKARLIERHERNTTFSRRVAVSGSGPFSRGNSSFETANAPVVTER